jgi:nitrite reductase/ring-hydroxylating ferredoxin subunit
VRTIIKDSRVVAAGRAAPFVAQRGVTLRLMASTAKVSRTSLSTSYGYPPSHGFYVTFRLTIANTGSKPVQIGPGNFVVVVPGEGRVTSYDGNGPYSGAHAQLDNTEVAAGEVLRAPISFDVRSPHGRLLFVPDTSAAVVWRF